MREGEAAYAGTIEEDPMFAGQTPPLPASGSSWDAGFFFPLYLFFPWVYYIGGSALAATSRAHSPIFVLRSIAA